MVPQLGGLTGSWLRANSGTEWTTGVDRLDFHLPIEMSRGSFRSMGKGERVGNDSTAHSADRRSSMEPRLAVLKAILDRFEVPARIRTIRDRKLVQKTLYLAQLPGVDLGYRFGWYLLGPYSPALTKDYYALEESIETDDIPAFSLSDSVAARLDKVKPLLDVPTGVPLAREDWLELVASVHFLRRISRRTQQDEAREVLAKEKTSLVRYVDTAEECLRNCGLL